MEYYPAQAQNGVVFTMTVFPGYVAWKSLVPGPSSNGYSYITNDADLILAEGNALPGSWKWFPISGAATQAMQAQAAAKWAGVTYNGVSGGSPSANIPNASKAVTSLDSGINAVGDFTNKLSEGNTWVRIAEGILGIVLIAIALAHATGIDNDVTKALKTGAKVAV